MDPKEKFSIRADDYVKFRPSYPVEAIDLIMDTFKLTPESVVADIGSGTGIFTSLFDNRVKTIFGVEPNKEMRDQSLSFLKGQNNYQPVLGDSENTNLDSNSIDAIVCAQAFHWFNFEKTRIEFDRILKHNKQVSIIWNIRDTIDPFFSEHEKLLIKYANKYRDAAHNRNFDDISNSFFAQHKKIIFPHMLYYDFESVCGLLNSASYCPLPGEQNHKLLFEEMKLLFEKYQIDNKVTFNYQTKLYIGTL